MVQNGILMETIRISVMVSIGLLLFFKQGTQQVTWLINFRDALKQEIFMDISFEMTQNEYNNNNKIIAQKCINV